MSYGRDELLCRSRSAEKEGRCDRDLVSRGDVAFPRSEDGIDDGLMGMASLRREEKRRDENGQDDEKRREWAKCGEMGCGQDNGIGCRGCKWLEKGLFQCKEALT